MTSQNQTIRVALVGCGQIADAHLGEIRKLPYAEVVGVCDVFEDLAFQAAARFNVPKTFADMGTMFEAVKPDVVHITTPVHTHAPLAIDAMRMGMNVYLEKPFAIDLAEADTVFDVAEETGKRITVGHDQSFEPIWRECLDIANSGKLGAVQHIDSILSYPIAGNFGRQVVANPNHWVRRLPGGLFQNTISHPLYRITDLMPDQSPEIWAKWFTKDPSIPFPTELRVHLLGQPITANLLFTSTTQSSRIVRIYGEKDGLEVDLDIQTIRHMHNGSLPGAFQKLQGPFIHFREAAKNLRRNIGKFARSEIHYFSGMTRLFDLFYQSILNETEPPIAYDEIRRVTRFMDEIFAYCSANEARAARRSELTYLSERTDHSAQRSTSNFKAKFNEPNPT